jgi:hypothetical protein
MTGTKEDNPLEELAKDLGFPAGVLAFVAGVWFLFMQGKPIQENIKAWKENIKAWKDDSSPLLRPPAPQKRMAIP